MSQATISDTFRFLLADQNLVPHRITVVWHAGEPMVLPLAFYREAFEIARQCNKREVVVEHAFQTNATLITQEWCDFIRATGIKVGVSLDGPKPFHDRYRVDRSGRGTFEKVMRGVSLLRRNNIPFHIIGVLTRESISHPDELWDFFSATGCEKIGFNIDEIEGQNTQSSMAYAGAAEDYAAFFHRFMQLRDAAKSRIIIREIDEMLDIIEFGASEVRGTENIPLCIFSISWDGCISTFSPELLGMKDPNHNDFVYGNVAEDQPHDILHRENFRTAHDAIQRGVDMCRDTCDYFLICGGGSPSNKLYENGSFASTETLACGLRKKALAELALTYLETSPPTRSSVRVPIRHPLDTGSPRVP